MIYIIDLLDEIRRRLDDAGGDLSPVVAATGEPVPFASWQLTEVEAVLYWKNQDLCRYLNWAIREIGERNPVQDRQTTSVCQITLEAGTSRYPLHPSILWIEWVVRDDGYRLSKTTPTVLHDEFYGQDWTGTQGQVERYLEDSKPGTILFYPTPTVTQTLSLGVYRTYLDQVIWNADLAQEEGPDPDMLTLILEDIPDSYRAALVAGACSQAWLRRDIDPANLQLQVQAATEFDRLVGPPVDARRLGNLRANAGLAVSLRPSRGHERWRWREDA